MSSKRDRFIFYRSFFDTIEAARAEMFASPEEIAQIYTAIVDYGLNKVEPQNLSGIAAVIWPQIGMFLQRNWIKYEKGCEGGEYGIRGGNPNFKKGKTNPYYKDNPIDNPIDNPQCSKEVKNKGSKEVKNNVCKETTTKVVAKKDELSLTLAEKMSKRSNAFYKSLEPFVQCYGPEMVRAFFDYWTEPNKSKTKMKFELEKFWDTKRRLNIWASRDKGKSNIELREKRNEEVRKYVLGDFEDQS